MLDKPLFGQQLPFKTSIPPPRLVPWPVRAGLSAGLASLLSLLKKSLFKDIGWDDDVLPVPVFATVVAIVCTAKTRGGTFMNCWHVINGTIAGAFGSALFLALLGDTVAAVIVINSLIGAAILYPRGIPVLAQKFAFGGSTIVVWGVYENLSFRWQVLGVPLCAALGAVAAVLVAMMPETSAIRAVKREADKVVDFLEEALDDAVTAYAWRSDPSQREMLRARVNNALVQAEAHLSNLKEAAKDARWERKVLIGIDMAMVLAGVKQEKDRKSHKSKAETFISVLMETSMALKGMELALEGLNKVQVDRWHLLEGGDESERVKGRPAPMFDGDPEGSLAAVKDVVVQAMRDAIKPRRKDDDQNSAQVAADLREALARLDDVIAEERRRHYAPSQAASDARETVARKALQANHLWIFSFQNLADKLRAHHEPAWVSSPGDTCQTCALAETSPIKKPKGPKGGLVDPRDEISALFNCNFRANSDQVLYALKLSTACAIAAIVGWIVSGNGSWAALAVSMVGTRESHAVGGSFNAALLRMQGTIFGAMFAYTIMSCVQGEHESWAGGLRLVLLAVFNFLCTFLRLNADYSYAGVVAAFTAYIVALGIPDGASTTEARAYAHLRIEQNLLGIVILVFIEVVLLPTFAQDAARRAASEAVAAAEHAAEVIYDATVGTDCISCRDRAAQDAGVSLDDLREKLNALNTLLVQAAAEPHLWSPKFPLEPYQRIATETESVRRVLGLMRAALTAMAQGSRGGSTEGSGDPRRMVRELLSPTDRFVTDLRRAVKQRLGRAAHDLAEGEGHWETKKAAASIARAQASLDRAFILHTLEIRVRFQAGEDDMFLPNHLMVPWHAYMSCTAVLASNVDNLSQASWEALLAVKPPVGDVTEEDWEDEIEDEEPAFSSGGGKYDDDDDDVRPISSSQPSFKRSGSGASGRSGDAPYTNGAGVKSPEQSLGRL